MNLSKRLTTKLGLPERIEFESATAVTEHLALQTDLTGAVFQNIDLTSIEDDLKQATLVDNVLLGCTAHGEVLSLFTTPIVFPRLESLPFEPYRATLYSPDELLGGYKIGNRDSYEATVDGATYKYYLETGGAHTTDVYVTLARRLHDHAITDALQEFVAGKKVVAIMGGHSMSRSDPFYFEVARLARDLVHRGFLPISGGGPGAMEATHLGAWFAERSIEELQQAIEMLAVAPLYDPIDKWMDAAFAVVEKFPITDESKCQSLGIPTWLYGHEPPTCFALNIAKYFANSVREEGLLAIAEYGVVFSPGSAGTIQEIFQDAAQNHYGSFGTISPMIFLGVDYWTEKKPVYPVLHSLSADKKYGQLLSITDSGNEALESLMKFAETIASPKH